MDTSLLLWLTGAVGWGLAGLFCTLWHVEARDSQELHRICANMEELCRQAITLAQEQAALLEELRPYVKEWRCPLEVQWAHIPREEITLFIKHLEELSGR